MTLLRNVDITAQDTMSIDAFGRWRVSEPYTIFDSKQMLDAQPLFWDDQQISGGSTSSTHVPASACTRMLVAANTAGNRTRQTFMRFNYQPGKSQLVLMTSRLSLKPTGITARVGMFDDNDGMFFQVADGALSAVVRSSVGGSPSDANAVAQASWNKDSLDGNGPSGITLDMTKAQIMFWDFEWLGIGRVRCGFVINGLFYVAHEFYHSNSVTAVYMSTPNLPLRLELINSGAAAQTTLDHICSTIMSEGGIEKNGKLLYISTGGTPVVAASASTIYAVVGIRLKSTALDSVIDIVKVAIQIQSASESGEWTLRLNPTVANVFTYQDVTNYAVQRALGGATNTVTGGTILQGGFSNSDAAASGGNGGTEINIENAIRLGSTIAGAADTLVLCWMPNATTTNNSIEGAITIRELS